MENNKKLSVIVPCYNEEDVLHEFYSVITKVLVENIKLDQYEILFVNDGSKDATYKILGELNKLDNHVQYLSFSRNFGKESAMYAGLQHADGDYTVIMDADLQHPPEVLIDMYREIQTGKYDMIATRRKNRDTDTKLRALFSSMFYRIMNKISGIDMGNNSLDYRMFNKKAKDAILSMAEYNRFSKGIFEWIGFRTCWLEIDIADRVAGNSKWSFKSLLLYSLEGCLAFSTMPLSLTFILGLLFCMIAISIIVIMVVQSVVYGIESSGYATIICTILITSGFQLFCIGIFGQYLAKTYLEIKNRPKYLLLESSKENEVEELSK